MVSNGTFAADTELLETVCAETPRPMFWLSGTATQRVEVDLDILARYVGVYELKEPATFGIKVFQVTLLGKQLFVDFNGKGRMPLVPLSNTTFSPRLLGSYEFVTDDQGKVNRLMLHAVEGTFDAIRQPEATVR
jgi:hypothetical protein